MDNLAAMIILGGLLMKLGTHLGLDPIQLGPIIVINFAVGMETPPLGLLPVCGVGNKRPFRGRNYQGNVAVFPCGCGHADVRYLCPVDHPVVTQSDCRLISEIENDGYTVIEKCL